jgi:GrpB-like predicted nucleotidyltransferase (UPF0157 family)
MIGLERGTVRVVAYTPEWAHLFEEERRCLQDALGAFALRIEHVGSTSVEGLAAKPIIDIAVAVGDLSRVETCVGALAALGYEHKGENGVPGRQYFAKGQPRTHHLHMFESESEGWRAHLRFRDRLRAYPSLVEEYAKLKRRLAGEFPTDRGAYTKAKASFVERVLESAEADAPEQ